MQNFTPEFVYEDISYKFGMHVGYNKKTLVRDLEFHYNNTPLRGFQIMPLAYGYKVGLTDKKTIEQWKQAGYNNRRRFKYCYIHAPYLINLAGAAKPKNPKFSDMLEKSKEGLKSVLDMGAILGAKVVVHIGSCEDSKAGLKTIIRSINEAVLTEGDKTAQLSKSLKIPIMDQRSLLLENGAGQGSYLGCNIDEMAYIYNNLRPEAQKKVGFCIDTAHLQGAGDFDMGDVEDIDRFYSEFDDQIGLDKLDCFHFNDSKVKLGAKRDAHEWVGEGKIFDLTDDERMRGLRHFVERAREEKLPMICEYGDRLGDEPGTAINKTWNKLCGLCGIESCMCCL